MSYVDITPLVDQTVSWAMYAPYESRGAPPEPSSRHTLPAAAKGEPFELFVSKTGIHAPTFIHEPKRERFFTSSVPSNEHLKTKNHFSHAVVANTDTDLLAKQRIKLMAVKYASNSASAELVARLEILNQRLLDHSPRVSQVQIEALELASEKLARIRESREARWKRLGISA